MAGGAVGVAGRLASCLAGLFSLRRLRGGARPRIRTRYRTRAEAETAYKEIDRPVGDLPFLPWWVRDAFGAVLLGALITCIARRTCC